MKLRVNIYSKQLKSTVAFAVLFGAAVVFFIAIVCIIAFLPSEPYADLTADYGMKFNYMRVNMVWGKDRTCQVTQELQAEFDQLSHGIYIDIPVNSGEKVRNLKVQAYNDRGAELPYSLEYESGFSIVRAVIGDPNRLIQPGHTLDCKVTYDYITPVHPEGENILDINAVGYGWTCPSEDVIVSVTYPEKPLERENFGVFVGGDRFNGVTVSNDGKTFTVYAGALKPFTGIRLKYEMPDSVLIGQTSYEMIWTVVGGILILAAAALLMIFVGREKPLTPIVGFYPPRIDGMDGEKRRMLPVQMGKVIDGDCSDNDVTSLIFYWASKRYIAIEERDGEIFLKKTGDLYAVTKYEQTLFNKIFSYASKEDGQSTVAVSQLSGKLFGAVNSAKKAVNAEYSGKLYKRWSVVLSVAFTALCVVFGVCTAVFTSFRTGAGFFHLPGLIVALPVLIAAGAGSILSRQYIKMSVPKRRIFLCLFFVLTLLLSVAVTFIVPSDVMSLWEKIIFAVCLGSASAISPFLTVRTPYYTEQLNEIIGFRDFLRDVEKDRLELLLKDDPQYYYNILPYANVLGVSDIWADKFKGLTIEPPSYYVGGDGITLFDIIILNRLASSIGRSITYSPPKANGGSFSGFGGGGSSGGGSFGGFGGGGGGRW